MGLPEQVKHVGLQWDNAKDTHWRDTGRDIEAALVMQLKMNPSAKPGFYEGYTNANMQLENPGDYYKRPNDTWDTNDTVKKK